MDRTPSYVTAGNRCLKFSLVEAIASNATRLEAISNASRLEAIASRPSSNLHLAGARRPSLTWMEGNETLDTSSYFEHLPALGLLAKNLKRTTSQGPPCREPLGLGFQTTVIFMASAELPLFHARFT